MEIKMIFYLCGHLMAISSTEDFGRDIVSKVTEAVTIMEYEDHGDHYIRKNNRWFQVFLYGTGYYVDKNYLKNTFPALYAQDQLIPAADKLIKFWDELSNSRDRIQGIFSPKIAADWSSAFQSDGDFLKDLMVPGKFQANAQFSGLAQSLSEIQRNQFFPGLKFKKEEKVKGENGETKVKDVDRFDNNITLSSLKFSRNVNSKLGYCHYYEGSNKYYISFQKQIHNSGFANVLNAMDSVENLMLLPWKNDPAKDYFSAHIQDGVDYFIDKKKFNTSLQQDILLYLASVSSAKQQDLNEKFPMENTQVSEITQNISNTQQQIQPLQWIISEDDFEVQRTLEMMFEEQRNTHRRNQSLQIPSYRPTLQLNQPTVQLYYPQQSAREPQPTIRQRVAQDYQPQSARNNVQPLSTPRQPIIQEYQPVVQQPHVPQTTAPIQHSHVPQVQQPFYSQPLQESQIQRNLLNFTQNDSENNVIIIRGQKWRCKEMPNGTYIKLHPIR